MESAIKESKLNHALKFALNCIIGTFRNNSNMRLFFLTCFLLFLSDAKAKEHENNFKRTRRDARLHSRLTNSWVLTDWNRLARSAIYRTKRTFGSFETNRAKNVILFLGDGMGASTIAAARLFKAEFKGSKATESYLTWENFPFLGLARTYNVDRSTPDSAGTATAYLSGIKTNYFTVGVTEKVNFKDCTNIKGNEVNSTLHKSIEAGKWAGVVTSARITHASPAGCYASTANREWEASVGDDAIEAGNCRDIALQLIGDDRNQNIKVLFGGGAKNFFPNNYLDPVSGKNGSRKDGRDLVEDWRKRRLSRNQNHVVLRTKKDLDSLDVESVEYALGLFNHDHLQYEVDKNGDEPTLADLTRTALQILSRNQHGFFLFVEGGRIDHAHHETNAYRALSETLAMEKAVEEALKLTDPKETLIIVTADHSHVFTLGGYGSFEESVLGFATVEALDQKPVLQLMYSNGPGYSYHRNDSSSDQLPGIRRNLSNVDTRHKDFLQDTAIWTELETHGGEDVPVYATGPWSHLFHSTEEQSYVAHVMMYASCVGDYTKEPHCLPTQGSSKNFLTAPTIGSVLFFNYYYLLTNY